MANGRNVENNNYSGMGLKSTLKLISSCVAIAGGLYIANQKGCFSENAGKAPVDYNAPEAVVSTIEVGGKTFANVDRLAGAYRESQEVYQQCWDDNDGVNRQLADCTRERSELGDKVADCGSAESTEPDCSDYGTRLEECKNKNRRLGANLAELRRVAAADCPTDSNVPKRDRELKNKYDLLVAEHEKLKGQYGTCETELKAEGKKDPAVAASGGDCNPADICTPKMCFNLRIMEEQE